MESASISSPGAFRFLLSTPIPAEPDKLAAQAEVKLTRECEQDKISTGRGAGGKQWLQNSRGCTSTLAATFP